MPKSRQTSPEEEAESIAPLHTKGLNRKEKQFALTTAFKELPATLDYSAKIRHLAKRQKTSPNTVLQQGERYSWRSIHEQQVAEAEAAEATARKAGVFVVLEPVTPVPPAAFLQELRSFTRDALAVSQNVTLVTNRLIALVVMQIDCHIPSTEMWDTLAWLTLDLHTKRLKSYIETAKGYAAPGQIASLLAALDFKSSLPPESQDGQRFATVSDLQKMLSEEASNLLPTAASVAAAFDHYQDIPDISVKSNF